MTLHFIYAFDPDSPQIQAPHSITRNLFHYLSQHVDVAYHRWDSKEPIELAPKDVVLGHPHYEANTSVQRIFSNKQPCKARCLIHPFHYKRAQDNMPFDFMAREADKLFLICGPYWYDTMEDSPFAHWKPKAIRLDSAVDPVHFPFLRTSGGPGSFNPPGERKLVYIGGASPHKNLHYLVEIMRRLAHVELHWFGGHRNHPLAKLPNVRVTGHQQLDKSVAEGIVNNYDIMVSVSLSDANPTTLTEARAWGLVTACTKESGYRDDPFFTQLYLDDMEATVSAIQELLWVPSKRLYERAVVSRKEIEQKYNWQNFGHTVWANIAEYFE